MEAAAAAIAAAVDMSCERLAVVEFAPSFEGVAATADSPGRVVRREWLASEGEEREETECPSGGEGEGVVKTW